MDHCLFLRDGAWCADIRELISVDDVMEEMHLGPNGALVYCMEYVLSSKAPCQACL
ncbi:hypothetical protein EON66_02900 [archaeon]|nr:MAG: hypothetical protein EON66_02900 [archaeon]